MNIALRPYQETAVSELYEAVADGCRSPALELPTGAGKTVIAAAIVHRARAKGRRVAFVAPYVSLIDQTVAAFGRSGIEGIGVIQADHLLSDSRQPVQICSRQTLEARDHRPEADLVIIDECHLRSEFLAAWIADPAAAKTVFVGLSATPWAKGMGKSWCVLLRPISMRDLTAQGYLTPLRVFAPSAPDLSKVRTRTNRDGERDYVEADLSEAMSDAQLVADVVTTWAARAEGRPTIVFAVDRGHAKTLVAQFEAAGVKAGYCDAYVKPNERTALGEKLRTGEINVVVNIDTLTAGLDWPFVSCIILARPTKSEIRFVQCVGRGLRPSPETGKVDCLVLDHSDTTSRLGFVDAISHDALDDGRSDSKAGMRKESEDALPKACPACSFMKPARVAICPNCHFKPEVRNPIQCADGELVELSRNGHRKAVQKARFGHLTDARLFGMLRRYGRTKGHKPGSAARKFFELRGRWPSPSEKTHPECEPSADLASWLKSQAIRYAKGRARHVA